MDAQTAIEGMIKKSGLTPAELSKAMGKSRTYIYSLKSQGSIPSLDTFARLAHECGYKVMLSTADGSKSVELESYDDRTEALRAFLTKEKEKGGTRSADSFIDQMKEIQYSSSGNRPAANDEAEAHFFDDETDQDDSSDSKPE